MMNGFPMVLHERSADGIIVRAEVPILETQGVIVLLCVECQGEHYVSTSELDLSDQTIFDRYADQLIARWKHHQKTGKLLPNGWYFAAG